jgi:hypothetical protein
MSRNRIRIRLGLKTRAPNTGHKFRDDSKHTGTWVLSHLYPLHFFDLKWLIFEGDDVSDGKKTLPEQHKT